MNRPISNRTLREIKAEAKKRKKTNKSLKHCELLDVVAKEIAGVSCFHEATVLARRNTASSVRVDPLEGLSDEERVQYYYRMMPILDREMLELYPESNQYLSDSDFDYDEY